MENVIVLQEYRRKRVAVKEPNLQQVRRDPEPGSLEWHVGEQTKNLRYLIERGLIDD